MSGRHGWGVISSRRVHDLVATVLVGAVFINGFVVWRGASRAVVKVSLVDSAADFAEFLVAKCIHGLEFFSLVKQLLPYAFATFNTFTTYKCYHSYRVRVKQEGAAMRKQRLSVCLLFFFMYSLSSCAKQFQSTTQSTSTTFENPTSTTTNETTSISTLSTVEDTTTVSSDEITSQEHLLSNADYWHIDPEADWCKAYVKYLEEDIPKWNDEYDMSDELRYTLIYLDDDDIPELYIFFNIESDGEMAVSYHNGNLSSCHFSRHFSKYIERSGFIYTHTGNFGWYPMKITKLDNGVFTTVLSGVTYITPEEQEKWNNGEEWSYTYELDELVVSKEEFDQQVNSFLDVEASANPDNYYSLHEFLNLLKTGHWESYNHRYEVILQDVTWIEAQKICQKKGGYLASITCSDEAETISQLVSSFGDDVYLYIGYVGFKKGTPLDELYKSVGWYEGDKHLDFGVDIGVFGCSYDPRYDFQNEKWDILNQNSGAVLYNQEERTAFIYTVPYNLVEQSSEYSGKVGFICEYNE